MSDQPKHTPGAERAAVRVSSQYDVWALDDVQNRRHTFRPERLKAIAVIVDEETAVPELLKACDKMAGFLIAWKDSLSGVQMTAKEFDDDSGLLEVSAAIAKAGE